MAKTLVVYYSQSRGNTKKIAREIASTLGNARRHRLGRKAEITGHTKTTRRLCRRVLFYGGYLTAGLL